METVFEIKFHIYAAANHTQKSHSMKMLILNSLFWFWVVNVGARYCALIVAKAAKTRIS